MFCSLLLVVAIASHNGRSFYYRSFAKPKPLAIQRSFKIIRNFTLLKFKNSSTTCRTTTKHDVSILNTIEGDAGPCGIPFIVWSTEGSNINHCENNKCDANNTNNPSTGVARHKEQCLGLPAVQSLGSRHRYCTRDDSAPRHRRYQAHFSWALSLVLVVQFGQIDPAKEKDWERAGNLASALRAISTTLLKRKKNRKILALYLPVAPGFYFLEFVLL
jgi:hypothetical protein